MRRTKIVILDDMSLFLLFDISFILVFIHPYFIFNRLVKRGREEREMKERRGKGKRYEMRERSERRTKIKGEE